MRTSANLSESAPSMGYDAKNASEEYQLVGFTVDGQEFGVEIRQIREIIRKVKMTKLPNSPEFVEGVVDLRGKVMSVVDLRRKFGIPQKEHDKDTRIIVTELSHGVVGFLADSVTQVRRVNESVIESPPRAAVRTSSSYVSGMARLEDRLLILLDLEKVLSSEEVDALSQVENTNDG